MRRSLIVAAMVAVLLVGSVAPAGATPPAEINIVVVETISGGAEPFVVSGPAVDNGLMCDTGTVVEDSGKVTGLSSPKGFNWLGIKHFTCGDGSGEVFMRMQARIKPEGGSTFHWAVVGGTGDYEDLHGAGSGVGLDTCGPDCVVDVYDGGLHTN